MYYWFNSTHENMLNNIIVIIIHLVLCMRRTVLKGKTVNNAFNKGSSPHHSFNKRFVANRFEGGMETLGLLTAVRKNKNAFQDVFVYKPNDALDAIMIENMFTVTWTGDDASNRRVEERRILSYWSDFLQDLGG